MIKTTYLKYLNTRFSDNRTSYGTIRRISAQSVGFPLRTVKQLKPGVGVGQISLLQGLQHSTTRLEKRVFPTLV